MAVDNPKFGKGIVLAGGFDLGAKAPLDSRDTVATIEERDLHITNNRAYIGMLVFVEENQKTYQCIMDAEGNLAWEEFGFNEDKFQQGIQPILDKDNEQDGRLDVLEGLVIGEGEGKGLDALIADINANKEAIELLNDADDVEGSVAKAVKDAVDPVQADLDAAEAKIEALEGKVGNDIDGENPATGLFLEVDQAKAAADAAQADVDVVEGRMDAAEGRLDAIDAAQEVQDGKIEENKNAAAAAQAAADKAQGEVDAVELRAEALEAADEVIIGRLDAIDAAQEAQDGKIEENKNAAAAAQAAADKAQGEVDAVELRVDALEAADEQHDAAIEAIEGRLEALEGADEALEPRVKANEEAIAKLNGGEDEEGSVAKAVKDAVDPVQADLDELEGIVGKAAEGENPATGLHKIIADADAQVLADAKAHAEQKIADLVDSAPDAMNTLNELAEAINAHGDVYEAYVEEVNGKLDKKVDKEDGKRLVAETEAAAWNAKAEVADVNQALADAKAYADGLDGKMDQRMDVVEAFVQGHDHTVMEQGIADNKAAAEAAQAAADKAQGEVDAVELRADALEAKVGHDIDGENPATGLFLEVDQAKAAADKAQGEVDAVELRVDGLEAAKDNHGGRIDALEAKVGHDIDGENPATGLFLEVDQAKAAADAAQADVDAVEGRMDTAEGEIDALQAFVQGHDHSVMEQGIADNKAAIEKLNGGEDVEGSVAKAIADALAPYADENKVKGMLGNIVNSLALTMEDNKLMLKLGGVEGITIHETSLDMATDDDIDEIIAGLDAPAGE